MSVTLLVSKLDRSKVVRFEQLLNMLFMSVTLLVSKLDASKVVRLEQLVNMLFMSVTLLVLNLDKSKVVRDEQCPVHLLFSLLIVLLHVSSQIQVYERHAAPGLRLSGSSNLTIQNQIAFLDRHSSQATSSHFC